MNSVMNVSHQWLHLPFLLLLLFINAISSTKLNIPSLSPIETRTVDLENHKVNSFSYSISDQDFKTYYYTQTLDHFNYRPDSYITFQQRYVINSKYWKGPNSTSPILVYFGAEAPLDGDLVGIGFLSDNALQFNALQIYIEHRYYGKSIPFGSREEALKNASTLGYFNSAQAIADYAEILIHVKKDLNAQHSPIIVIGGSYGGMLASWFRLKYPHIAIGALASSAPILYFDDITPENGYYSIVTKDFREASESCYQTIKKSWSIIDKVAAQPNGLSNLSLIFHTCSPLNSSAELKNFLDSMYTGAAQYNSPPRYPVDLICRGIDDGVSYNSSSEFDILKKIFAGVVAYKGNTSSCYVNEPKIISETVAGWRWQTCSEMVIPIGISNDTMFPEDPFNLTTFSNHCKDLYGVPPRPHWVTTYYGGHDIKLVLHRFGSNIIFSNGLRDPYSSGGVLDNISDSILAVHTTNGSHCLDILHQNNITDPDWLVKQRKIEVKIIKRWIDKYYADLKLLGRMKKISSSFSNVRK